MFHFPSTNLAVTRNTRVNNQSWNVHYLCFNTRNCLSNMTRPSFLQLGLAYLSKNK